jgi:tRNA (adenine22-N1)-methyltransferase
MDINKGPLQKAKKNIEAYDCVTQIDTRLSDGAKKLEVGEVDTTLISGMGGRLTCKILAESIDVVRKCSQLVLQPQSEIYLVRHFLEKIGFSIIYEDMLIEDGKYYVIINAKNESNLENDDVDKATLEQKDVNIDDLDNNLEITVNDKYGKYLLDSKNDILYEFLLKEITKINDITVELSNKNGNDERLQNRINELNKEKELVSEALKYYE